MTKIVNENGYAYFQGKPTHHKRLELKVTFILDDVPGAFHQPEDLMRRIADNPYVDTVELVEPEPAEQEDDLIPAGHIM